MTQGYVIHAVNTSDTDYECCARVLEKSLRLVGDVRPVTVITADKLFDDGVGSRTCGPYADDWQLYYLSPYDQTFKLEADMLVTRPLDSWWSICNRRDMLIAQGCKDYKQVSSTQRYYRQFNDRNKLPDLYNGITYFRKSRIADQFYETVREIWGNWSEINNSLSYPSPLQYGDTDSVYALAASILGIENFTLPECDIGWVHMKQHINGLLVEDWTRELFWELIGTDFRINTYSQIYPVHYHVKALAKELEALYDRQIQTLLQH